MKSALVVAKKAAYALAMTVLTITAICYYGFIHMRPDSTLMAERPTQTCDIAPQKLLDDINEERAKLGVEPLVIDTGLVGMAEYKLYTMTDEHYYGHNTPEGTTFKDMLDHDGLTNVYASEDLDANVQSADQAWNDFKASPSHYASVTNSHYNHVGISTKCGLDYVNTQDTSPQSEPQVTHDTTGMRITSLVVVHLTQ